MVGKCVNFDEGGDQERAVKIVKPVVGKRLELTQVQCNSQGRDSEADVCRQRGLNPVCPVEGHFNVISMSHCASQFAQEDVLTQR